MELVRITELSQRMGISSRSLRYYEQVGLLHSVRPRDEKYRYYDAENIERLEQVLVLRKMEIPIKDILRIYESRDMSVLVEAFVGRINAIDEEVTALSELRRVVDSFLQAMLQNGISKISGLPLLYEEMGKQLLLLEKEKPVTYAQLSAASARLEKEPDLRVEALPPMRMLSSLRRDTGASDVQGLWDWLGEHAIPVGLPGEHTLFEYEDAISGTVLLQRLPQAFVGDAPYAQVEISGGLFAVGSLYADEDMGAYYRRMVQSLDSNAYYEIDYLHDGSLRQAAMLETVRSPDLQRERLELYLPVKQRVPDVSLYAPGEQLQGVSAAEIEAANPILWSQDVPMDGFRPILHPQYWVNDAGEAVFVASIDKRLLSTEVSVRIPFRVDIEFRVDEGSATFANGSDEGSIRFYHLNCMYGINMQNNADSRLSRQAIRFDQPVFGDSFSYPRLGRIEPDAYNRLTWIVGETHFAVIINGEVRFCGVRFPYMTVDMRVQPADVIRIGSNGKGRRYFRAVRVSQLRQAPIMNIKEGTLAMVTRQSNNRIPNIHQLITMHYGENYWFNGCAKYVMESLGEPAFDYWFFSGLTGDSLAQVFSYDRFRGDGATDYQLSDGETGLITRVFDTCGYASTFVNEKMLAANREMYLQTLMAFIDRGIPVIVNLSRPVGGREYGFGWGVFVGYEDFGKTLLYLTEDKTEPERIALDAVLPLTLGEDAGVANGWIFVGEKRREVDIAKIYRDVVLDMPRLLTTKTDGYCFGAEAFRAWARHIESGGYDGVTPETFSEWAMYTIYVCNVATNGSCRQFLERALEKNPDMTFLAQVLEEYKMLAVLWTGREGAQQFTRDSLESLGGGFNVTLDALHDPARRKAIAAVIYECAACMDRVMALLPAQAEDTP